MAVLLNSPQRPLSTIAEDPMSAEDSIERPEDASPSLRPASDGCERGDSHGRHDNSLLPPQREDDLLVKSDAVGNGGVEKGDKAEQEKGNINTSVSFDEADAPTERQRAILSRVLSQWKRTVRKDQKEEATSPSKNSRTLYTQHHDHTLNYTHVLIPYL